MTKPPLFWTILKKTTFIFSLLSIFFCASDVALAQNVRCGAENQSFICPNQANACVSHRVCEKMGVYCQKTMGPGYIWNENQQQCVFN